MNVLCIFLVIVGLALISISLFKLGRIFPKARRCNILELTHEIQLPSKGKYNIGISGGDVIEEGRFRIRISSSGLDIPVQRNNMKFWATSGVAVSTFLYCFVIPTPGNYLMTIEYPRDLVVKATMLKFTQTLQQPLDHEGLQVVIQKTLPVAKIVLCVLMILTSFILWILAIGNYEF